MGHGWDTGTLGPKTDFMCTMAATSAAAAGRAKVEVFLFLEKYPDWRMGARARHRWQRGEDGGHGDLADGGHLNGENGSDKNWWPPRNVKLLILTYSWGH